MMSRYMVIWTVLLLLKADGIYGGPTAFYGPYNVATENPVLLFEVQGAREVNKFTSGGLYQAKINENAAIGTYVRSPVKMGLYVAEDVEKIEYFILKSGIQRTTLNCSWTSTFTLEGQLIENFYFLRLKTTRMLSEESCKSYLVTINAQSRKTKRIIDTTQINIEVKVSSNMPSRFKDANPKANIPSNFPLFQPILQLDIADRNKHNIGKVYFLLKRQSKYFSLNPVNGVLFLKRPLPRGLTQHGLVAYTRRWDSRVTRRINDQLNTCKISVSVSLVNQYAPSISVGVVDNVENTANMVAANIIVSDQDQGMDGRIESFEIISGDEDRHFRLEKVTSDNTLFRLRLVKPNMNPKVSKPSLTFIATDKGNPPKSSTAVYSVNLVDALSTSIQFPKDNYFVNVSEMVPINYTVIQVKALNLKPSSRFSYSIVHGDSSNRFRMESITGSIVVGGTLDAEKTLVYTLKIELNVTGGITLKTTVHIQVEDFNDHVPKFTSDNHFVEIQENMALHTSIYKVVAKDGDSGDNGLVSYWLPDSDRFAIHPYTGVISVKRVYDRDSGIPEYAYIIVRAGDSGSPIRRETETMVKVKIKAWNDNQPIVKQNDCTISLSPDTPVGTKLLQIQAIDIDVDTIDQLTFSLAMGNTGNYFHINSISGDVSIAKPLGDARSSYSLVVFANDGTYKSLNSAFLQVTIDSKKTGKDVSCTDSSVYIKALKRKSEHQVTTAIATEPVIDRNPPQNIHAPRFTHREWAITVSEDLDIGSALKTIKATDNDNGYEGLLNYYIVNGNINQSFDVDVETGELKSVGQLDREQVPKYELNISAWDLGISRKADFIKVVVTVKDVNDNAPVFEQKVYNISVFENTPVRRTVLKLIAKDDDEGINKRVTYQLLDDNDKLFFIDYNTGDLIINKPLDFEEEKAYDLKVLALDGSSTNQHIGQAQVIINVLDKNDNPPIVNPVMQDIFVMKDYPVGSPITQVVASDPDSGDGGKVSFTLGKSYGSDLFSITDSTGLLKLKRSLTASLDDVYNLTVVVSDHGQPPLMSNIQVNLHIMQRISDEDVQIMSNQGGITKYSVPENSLTGIQIGQLTNPDRHSEQQNSFFFSIIDGTDITKFDLTETSGLLTTTESLDREEIPYYWLTIQVLTQQSRQFHNNIQLLINVDDKNDNSPIFSPPVYESKIPENTPAEEVVVVVSAFDRDAGENGRLDYSIVSGNNEGHFKINETTGFIITTKISLDYEKKKMYQLFVKVTDNGSPPRSSDASLTILIQDENDNHPKYKDNLNIDFLISGTSDIAKDTLFGQVLASDEDQGHNGDITFSILSGDNSGKFRIDPKSGQLFSNVTLYSRDYDFQLQVEAKDNGNPSLSARTRIIVIVTKQLTFGQNPPTFPKKQVNITLPENTPVGHKIDITPATDKDFLVYFIKSGNEDQRFQLDSHGTSLKLIAKLDSAKKYHVVISATDGLYSTDFSLNIKVKDVNDHYPVPEMIEKIITVPENVSPGTKVVTVKASDLDTAGINSKILFSFKSAINSKSLKLFDINENTGEITVKGTLDYEDIRSHVLIVAITDSVYQPKESTMYVVVNVADVNEWKPQFIKPSYRVVIPENIQSGSDIVKVFAKDKDQAVDAVLKYSISSGNHGFAFKIKPESGVIQTNKKLQASHISQYFLTVEVRDDGADGLSASVNVTVSLLSHGYRPGFAKNVFPVSLYENQPINTIVEAIGFDGLMTFYTIMNRTACATDFQMNPFTGVITTKKIFDAEKISSCHMRVEAQDGDGYSQESTVHIDIKDMNDNAPQMEEQVFIGYINENAPMSTLVLNAEGQPLVIAAFDVDIEPNNRKLKYKIINPGMDSYFKIDENKGALFTSKFNLDYEIAQSYTFLVKVSDQGLPSLSQLATVVVHVKNSNDVAPEFSKVVFEVLMYLPTINGVHVTTLTASDQDNLGNLIFSIKQQDTSLLIVNHKSGEITIADASKAKEGWYNAVVEVNDGKMSASANVRVLFKPIPVSALQFPRPSFVEHIRENTSLVQAVFTPFVRGYNTRERIRFSLRNLQDTFSIKESTGVIQTKPGVVIDREKISSFRLFILAQDDSTPPRMAHSIVNVIVDDVNDCRPTFPPPPIFFVVPKSSETGSTIATITALDCDDGKNGEIRYEIKSDKSKKFGIDSGTGVLKVLGQLVGLTTPAEFTLIIEASDLGEKPLRSEAEVSVRIESGDACIFQKPSYNVELSEDTTVDKVFKRLHARCPDGKPVFNIISGDNFGQIVCDLNTGELSLSSKLDFETTTGYRLTVRAKDTNTGASSKTMVNIVVKDVNDNAPIFKGTPYFARVRENSPADSRLMRVVATDLDNGANKNCSYEIVDDVSGKSSRTFAIDPVTGILSVKKMLDYEKDKRFGVTVRVSDHGQPSLSSKTLIRVFVTDLNDNAPTFQKSQYSATVLDNAGPNHFITQVLATDKDEMDFEKLKYNIVSGHGKNFFGIDAISGVVSLSQVPGLVLGKVYTLKLSVNDGNFTSYTTLDVVVGQTNNHPPVFRTDVFHAQVTENYPADTYVAMVTATDQDSGTFGEVVYAIDNEKAAKDFKIDKVSGIVTTRKPLDREVLSSITILIRATDRGGKSTFCYVMVDILDENDNQPQFLMPGYTGVVSITRASVGENVVRVTAVDLDEGVNSELTYNLVGQISPFVFGINSSSGAITFLRKPRESTYNFYVRVTDKGHLKLRSYAQVRVFVMSLPFRFKQRTYPVSIYETVQGNISLKLQLIDKNGALVTSNIDYSIEVGSSPKTNKLGTFNIDSSGELQVSKNLDYETIDMYELTVRANRSSFSAYTIVHIKVLDKNDNIPEFESSLYVVNIPEDSPKGTRVVQVQAHDKDSKENGMVTYEMSAESKKYSNVFAVDNKTGWITSNGHLDRETVSSYTLHVTVKDHGKDKQFSSITSVNINIDDVNDSPPVFSKILYVTSIKEDSPIGTEVLSLNMTDKDIKPRIVYYIVNGDRHNHFNVDQNSGKIYVKAKLDHELVPRYLLSITASDGAFTNSTLVKIEIIDVNDNKPSCSELNLRIPVLENITVGTFIAVVNATDKDEGNNSRIAFAIFNHHEKFSVDSITGIIKLDQRLDREKKSSYNFLVSASDGDGACYTNVTIDVLDINDSPPEFTKPRYIKLVPIDSEKNAFLLRVEATDKDIGLNRKLTYAFSNATVTNVFSIEKETGIISLQSRLLSRDEEKFVFNVVATDSGVPALSSESTVEIVVSTITNCSFVKNEYKSDIREDTNPIYVFDTVSAICSDRFNISYRIADNDAKRLFAMNEKKGTLSLQASLDYEYARVHNFDVEAFMVKKSGKTILISSSSIKIKVVDCNDNKPEFKKISYEAMVNEDSSVGVVVVSVYASDNDTSETVTYSIIKSVPDDAKFTISSSGVVSVQGALDREKTEEYELLVRAQDSGKPPLSSNVTVLIKIKDVNDNPPVVKEEIKTLLPTNTVIGAVVFKLTATDADGPSNSKPFMFTVLSGENNMFHLNSSSGALTTKRRLSRHNTTYSMMIRTTDNGSPPMFTDTSVEITVVKFSLNPPKVRPVTVYVNMLTNDFKGGIVGKVIAHDPDNDNILQFSLLEDNAQFSIGRLDGAIRITSLLNRPSYSFVVQVTDGTHKVNTKVTVRAKEITPIVVENSVGIRITGKTLSDFVSLSLSPMVDTLADIVSCTVDEVYLWSIQTSSDNKLDVVFAIKKPEKQEFYDPNYLRKVLERQLTKFQRLSDVVVFSVGIFPCDEHHCTGAKECRNKIKAVNTWSILSSDATTFLSYKNKQESECVCPEGKSVLDCTSYSKCSANPCKSGLECVDRTTRYECVCPKGKNCKKECHGDKCHEDAMTFNGNSYIRYSLTDKKAKLASFSVSVKTTKPSGTILSVKGDRDYFITEIVEGKVRVRVDYGGGETIARLDQVKVNDGQWHELKVTRTGRNVRLTLNPGRYMAEALVLGSMRFLDVETDAIIVGGELPRRARRNSNAISNGYFGCMESPAVDDNDLPLSGSNAVAKAATEGVIPNCSIAVCHPSFCQNDGQCKVIDKNGYKVPSCTCKPGFTGVDCGEDVNECDSKPCKNSGVCVNSIGSFKCNCVDKNFNGDLCATSVAAISRTEPLGTREFIYIGTTVFVLIIIAIIIACACRCWHKRRNKAKARGMEHERHEMKVKDTNEELSPHPPIPPPRRGDADDPPTRLGSRAPSWDYADLPEMGLNRRKLSESESFVDLPSKSCEDLGEYSGANGIPQVPRRPRHLSETQSIPDVPKKPSQYRCSRASSQNSILGENYAEASEFGEEDLDIIRQGTKDIEKLAFKAADVMDSILGTRCASPPSECDTRSECSEVNELLGVGHLETYDHNEVDYFIPENDQDNASDDETSIMLEKLPDVRHSRGEVLHKESQL